MHLEDKSTSHELGQHSLETAAIIRERDGGLTGATRRAFLRQALGFATASSAFGVSLSTGKAQTDAEAANTGSQADRSRRAQAFRVRVAAAQFEKEQPMLNQIDNGDEARYPNKIGSFSKGLPHNDLGE